MTHFTKIATGLTGLAALAAVSSPAGAQMNPYGYGNNGGPRVQGRLSPALASRRIGVPPTRRH